MSDPRPEDDPRYLPPVAEFVPRGETPEALEAAIDKHMAMLATFDSPGWELMKTNLEERRQGHIDGLTKITGVDTMDAIHGLRVGLRLLEEMLGQEDYSKKLLKRDSEKLNKIRKREAQ
jgi:hypothetical protein